MYRASNARLETPTGFYSSAAKYGVKQCQNSNINEPREAVSFKPQTNLKQTNFLSLISSSKVYSLVMLTSNLATNLLSL